MVYALLVVSVLLLDVAARFVKPLKDQSAVCLAQRLSHSRLLPVSVVSAKKDPRLARAGVSGYNKPKRTPNHPKKSHVVVAKQGDQVKTIRFGQQGVTGDKKPTKRQASFKARHAKNIAKGKMSAAYWANKVKW